MRTITRDIVGALIISSDNKVLLGRTAPKAGGVYSGKWVIPGGGIEPGETKLQALQREVREETQLDITGLKPELVDDAASGESEKNLKETGERVLVKMQFIDYRIVLNEPAAKSGAAPTEELVELVWVAFGDLPSTDLSPPTIELLKKLGYMP